MQRIPFLSLTAVWLLCISLPASAQKFQPKTIQFKGAPEYSDAELLATAGLQIGVVLDFAGMKEHAQMLMSTGVFETLNFQFDGVDLIYNLVPSTSLYPIHLENLPLTPGKELETKLHERFPLFHGKVPGEGGLQEGVRKALEEMLLTKGIKATLEAIPYTDPRQRKVTAMSFVITAPPVRVGPIHLEGASAAMQAAVQKAADHETGAAYSTESSNGNLEHALESFYAEEGYAAVKAHISRSGDPVATADAIDVPFSATIEEGRLYKLGSIHLPPDAPVTQAEIDKVAGPHSAMAKGQTLRDTWFMIASRYKSKGYLDCTLTPHPEFDEATDTVNYEVEVTPGPVYHLAFVKFEGVSDELRVKLMRVWQMLPGDPFDQSYVSGFIIRAQKEDPVLMRSLSGVGVSYKIAADPETHEVNCVLSFARMRQSP
jgi:outer membrane protein assembly factor BamA